MITAEFTVCLSQKAWVFYRKLPFYLVQACFDEDDNDSSLFPPSIIHNDYFAAAEAICVVFFLHVRNGLTYKKQHRGNLQCE